MALLRLPWRLLLKLNQHQPATQSVIDSPPPSPAPPTAPARVPTAPVPTAIIPAATIFAAIIHPEPVDSSDSSSRTNYDA